MRKQDQVTSESIKNLYGLSDKELGTYLTLLENGPMLPLHIAEKAGIKRTTLYEFLPQLLSAGFIFETSIGKRRGYAAVSPEKLIAEYKSKHKEIISYIESLNAVYKMQGLKPKLEIYEGLEGVKKVHLDTLKQKKEILSYNRIANYQEAANEWFMKKYIPERIRRGIWLRAIVPSNKVAKESLPNEKKELRRTHFVPENKFPFKIDGVIYGNKVAYTLCEKGKPLFGIIIESKEIAQTQKALFDLAWEGAERYQEK